MYKYIGIIALSILMATSVQAGKWTTENCTNRGGIIITGNKYDPNHPEMDQGGYCTNINQCPGREFCHSQKTMNWWSAMAWCEAHGGKLASMTSLCPTAVLEETGYTARGSCPQADQRLKVAYGVWTTTTQGCPAGQVWSNDNRGGVYCQNRSDWQYKFAICE